MGQLIQITCFGDFVALSGDRELFTKGEEGASYKAYKVLAFLASRPHGSIDIDMRLAAVWDDVLGPQGYRAQVLPATLDQCPRSKASEFHLPANRIRGMPLEESPLKILHAQAGIRVGEGLGDRVAE